jgi:hypothetical protein
MERDIFEGRLPSQAGKILQRIEEVNIEIGVERERCCDDFGYLVTMSRAYINLR